MFLQSEHKIKRVRAKQSLLTNAQILKKDGIDRVKEDKRCKILCKLGSVKNLKAKSQI